MRSGSFVLLLSSLSSCSWLKSIGIYDVGCAGRLMLVLFEGGIDGFLCILDVALYELIGFNV